MAVAEYLFVPEAEHTIALRDKPGVSLSVPARVMQWPVGLNDQLMLHA